MITTQGHLLDNLKKIRSEVILHGQTEVLSHLRISPTLIDQIKAAESKDPSFRNTFKGVKTGCFKFILDENGVL